MNSKTNITNQTFLYWVAFLLALTLRVLLLDSLPLNEFESTVAYQAHQISQGIFSSIEDNASYVFITGFLFTIFNSSDILARLLPAILGSLVTWVPFLFRKSISPWAGIITAFALAIDSGLVPLSRVAGGSGITIGFLVLLLLFLQKNRFDLAGIFFTLFLFSGSSAYFGIFVLAGVWTVNKIFRTSIFPNLESIKSNKFWKSVGFTTLLFGTYFLQYPAGLSSLFSGIEKIFSPSQTFGFDSILQGLFLSNPIFWLASLLLIIYSLNKKTESFLPFSYWAISALGFFTVFLTRDVNFLPWLIIPAWIVIAIFLSTYVQKGNLIVWGKTIVVLLFLLFFWINLQQFSNLSIVVPLSFSDLPSFFEWDRSSQVYFAHIIILLMIPVFIVFTTYLFSSTWSTKYAIRGLVWGVSFFSIFIMFGSTVQATFYPQSSPNQLWYGGQAGGNMDIVVNTIERIAELEYGTRTNIDIKLQVNFASLNWVLRDFTDFSFTNQIDVNNLPTVAITELVSDNIYLHSAYRGTNFAWQFLPAWVGTPPSLAKWITLKEAPTVSDQLVLWVRADAFPDGTVIEESLEPTIENEIINPALP